MHYVQVVDEVATKEAQEKADEEAKKEGKDSAEPVEPVMKSESKEVLDWRIQNDNKPLWTRSPKDVRTPSVLAACASTGLITALNQDPF